MSETNRLAAELAALQAENERLKEIKRLEAELVTIQAKNRRLTYGRPEEELSALQAENRLLKEIKRLEEQTSAPVLVRLPLNEEKIKTPDDANAEGVSRGSARRPKVIEHSMRKQKEHLGAKGVDDFDVAMASVGSGRATLVQLNADEFTATCGDESRAIPLSQSAHVGDWLDSLRAIIEGSETYCRELYSDENRIILGAGLSSKAIGRLLSTVEKLADHLEDEGWSPLLPPGHYDSYGKDR